MSEERKIKLRLMIMAGTLLFFTLISFKAVINTLGLLLYSALVMIGVAYLVEAVIDYLTKK